VKDAPALRRAPVVRAIVLAAGAGRRFGGDKQVAELEGRPLLQHVLDALAAAGIDDPIVVLGANEQVVRGRIDWRAAEVAINPAPETGLAGSLQVGWAAAMNDGGRGDARGPADAAIVVLGDQPRLRAEVVRSIVSAELDAERPIVAPRYAGGGGRNPVRIERSAAAWLAELDGDRGLGPLIERRPELVRSIDVSGTNPDVDLPADLRALAAAPSDLT
jgi:molybdenum cofactor cytidylyltransferase